MVVEQIYISIALTMIILPWAGWVTASIFNQRQEIALLKQSADTLRRIEKLLSNSGT